MDRKPLTDEDKTRILSEVHVALDSGEDVHGYIQIEESTLRGLLQMLGESRG